MADLYVQVEVGLPDSKLVDRACSVLGLSTDAAVGSLVLLWLAVMRVGCGGNLTDRTDRWIEAAAHWRGEPGKFAKFIREHHLTDGVVKDWDTKYGALEAFRRADAERKRHGRSTGRPRNVRGQGADDPPPIPAESATPSTSPSPAVGVVPTLPTRNTEQAEPGEEEFGAYTEAVRSMLRAAQSPRSALASLRMLVQEGAEPALVGRAVLEMAANGERFNVARLRGFVRSLKAGPPPGPATLTGAEVMLDRALAWSRDRGGYKHIQPEDYRRDVPEDVRAALSACGGLKAFEVADDIGLRALRKKFAQVYRPEVAHARA